MVSDMDGCSNSNQLFLTNEIMSTGRENNNNFKALFSTFKVALGSADEKVKDEVGSLEKKPTGDESNAGDDCLLPLKDRIQRQWRISQIRQANKKRKFNHSLSKYLKVKVAVCAIIVDDFRYEHIWRKWAADDDYEQKNHGVEFIVHAKFPEKIRSDWVRSKTLDFSHRPDWNDVRIIKAMLDTLKEALKDLDVTHMVRCSNSVYWFQYIDFFDKIQIPFLFIFSSRLLFCVQVFVTESCIPITPSKNFFDFLNSNPGKSFFNYHDSESGSRFDELEIFSQLSRLGFPMTSLHKALPGWITICRQHASDILKLEYTVDAFETIWAPEEVFFPSILSLSGALQYEVLNRSLTYAKWPTDRKDDKAHPLTYRFERFDINRCQKEGFFFARKFVDKIELMQWHDSIKDLAFNRKSINNSKSTGFHGSSQMMIKRAKSS